MGDLQDRWKWDDPDPQKEPGILLSDRIQFYTQKVGLISPFDPSCLTPASYTLHAGDEYWFDDEPRKPNAKFEIIVPENALIFLKIYEELNLPYYLIAQHDLKVKQVHRGFLAGRSLLIDPGYSGHIYYPIYNFTNQERVIRVREELISICFIKTTSFGSGEWRANRYVETAGVGATLPEVTGLNGYKCIKFPVSKDRPLPDYWRQGEAHQSSVVALRQEVNTIRDNVKKEIDRLRNIAVISGIAVIVALAGILLKHHYWTADNIISVNKDVSTTRSSVEELRNELNEFKPVLPKGQPAEEVRTPANTKKQNDSGK